MSDRGIVVLGLLALALLAAVCTWKHQDMAVADVDVEQLAPTAAGPVVRPAPVASAPTPPVADWSSVVATFSPPQVVLTGRVGDAATRAAIVARARKLYGADQVRDEMTLASVRSPAWLATQFPPDLRGAMSATAAQRGERLVVEGEAVSAVARDVIASSVEEPALAVFDNRLRLHTGDPIAEDIRNLLSRRVIEFAVGSDRLTAVGRATVNEVAKLLRGESGDATTRFLIGGHTDSIGAPEFNQWLSLQRATAVRVALVRAGLEAGRFEVQGFGAEQPVAPNDTGANRQRNRRIEFIALP